MENSGQNCVRGDGRRGMRPALPGVNGRECLCAELCENMGENGGILCSKSSLISAMQKSMQTIFNFLHCPRHSGLFFKSLIFRAEF